MQRFLVVTDSYKLQYLLDNAELYVSPKEILEIDTPLPLKNNYLTLLERNSETFNTNDKIFLIVGISDRNSHYGLTLAINEIEFLIAFDKQAAAFHKKKFDFLHFEYLPKNIKHDFYTYKLNKNASLGVAAIKILLGLESAPFTLCNESLLDLTPSIPEEILHGLLINANKRNLYYECPLSLRTFNTLLISYKRTQNYPLTDIGYCFDLLEIYHYSVNRYDITSPNLKDIEYLHDMYTVLNNIQEKEPNIRLTEIIDKIIDNDKFKKFFETLNAFTNGLALVPFYYLKALKAFGILFHNITSSNNKNIGAKFSYQHLTSIASELESIAEKKYFSILIGSIIGFRKLSHTLYSRLTLHILQDFQDKDTNIENETIDENSPFTKPKKELNLHNETNIEFHNTDYISVKTNNYDLSQPITHEEKDSNIKNLARLLSQEQIENIAELDTLIPKIEDIINNQKLNKQSLEELSNVIQNLEDEDTFARLNNVNFIDNEQEQKFTIHPISNENQDSKNLNNTQDISISNTKNIETVEVPSNIEETNTINNQKTLNNNTKVDNLYSSKSELEKNLAGELFDLSKPISFNTTYGYQPINLEHPIDANINNIEANSNNEYDANSAKLKLALEMLKNKSSQNNTNKDQLLSLNFIGLNASNDVVSQDSSETNSYDRYAITVQDYLLESAPQITIPENETNQFGISPIFSNGSIEFEDPENDSIEESDIFKNFYYFDYPNENFQKTNGTQNQKSNVMQPSVIDFSQHKEVSKNISDNNTDIMLSTNTQEITKIASSSIELTNNEMNCDKNNSNITISDNNLVSRIVIEDYKVAYLEGFKQALNLAGSLDDLSLEEIKQALLRIINTESPISQELIVKEFQLICRRAKITFGKKQELRILSELTNLCSNLDVTVKNGFIELNNKNITVRKRNNTNISRTLKNLLTDPKYIAPNEIITAYQYLLHQGLGMVKPNAYEILELLGISIHKNLKKSATEDNLNIDKKIALINNILDYYLKPLTQNNQQH